MDKPIISIICAIDKNRAIGKGNGLLWRIPEDLKRFKNITSGHAIIMGRKTFESIGRPLPNRTNIIVTSDKSFIAENCIICHTIEEALIEAKKIEREEIFIIGGGQIYNQTINSADKLYLTLVDGEFEADTFFPEYDNFKITKEESGYDENHKYKFLELEKYEK